MSKRIYATNEWSGYGKQNYYHNEYWQDGDTVEKRQYHRFKSFDGCESNWETNDTLIDSWNVNDSDMPSWLKEKI